MGRLAELAKTKALKGKVTVTLSSGVQKTFADEAEAEKATAGLALVHRRGAFFQVGAEAEAAADAASGAGPGKKQKKA